MEAAEAVTVPPGHRLVSSVDLVGQALAWGACAAYEVPAAIFEGVVHVEAEPGKWLPFDPEAMLRSLVAGRASSVLVPDEIVDSIESESARGPGVEVTGS